MKEHQLFTVAHDGKKHLNRHSSYKENWHEGRWLQGNEAQVSKGTWKQLGQPTWCTETSWKDKIREEHLVIKTSNLHQTRDYEMIIKKFNSE